MTSELQGKVTRDDNKTLYLVLLGIFFIVAALVYYAVDRYVLQERLRKEERTRAAEQMNKKKGAIPVEILRSLSAPAASVGSVASSTVPEAVMRSLTVPAADAKTQGRVLPPASTPLPSEVLKNLSVP